MAPADLLTRPAHSLLVQSYRPREMTSGTVSADGFGAALWLDDGRPEPALYRTAAPIWADPNLGWIGERLRATAALAAVRSATPGIGYELSNVQPFARGRLSLVHNGFVERFRQGPQREVRRSLGRAAYEAIAGTSDSEHLFALALDALDREAGDPSQAAGARPGRPAPVATPSGAEALAAALRSALGRLERICAAHQVPAVAAVVLSDGASLAAARWSVGTSPASLYWSEPAAAGQGARAGHCVASEPLWPDGGWRPVPPQTLLVIEPGRPPRQEALP